MGYVHVHVLFGLFICSLFFREMLVVADSLLVFRAWLMNILFHLRPRPSPSAEK